MGLLNTLRFISRHPLNRNAKIGGLGRWLRWQIGSRVLGWPVVVPFVGETRLLAKPGMTGVTGNIYCGLHEFEDMGFVLHFLRPGDLFVDIGANIGSYTILASAAGAHVISFEPVPSTFEALLDNVHLNRLEHSVVARNEAVSRIAGELEMTVDRDTTNHILVGGSQYAGKSVRVPVVTLDSALQGKVPRLIKIDVEGFETEVLAGARATLENPGLGAVLMELNGSGAHFGFDENALHCEMQTLGFRPYRYDPLARRLIDLQGARSGAGNTLYLREPELILAVVKASPSYQVLGSEV